MIDWVLLLGWEGYDLVGIVISLFGGIFAFRANRNAKKASEAASRAVTKTALVDVVAELGFVNSRIEDIRSKSEINNLERASEIAREIAVAIAKIVVSENVELNDDTKSRLGEIKLNVQKLIELFELSIHKGKELDQLKVRQILHACEEAVAMLQVQTKEKVNQDE